MVDLSSLGPVLETNAFFDGLRVFTAIWSGMLLPVLVLVGYRYRNYGFYALSIFILISVLSSIDRVGEPFLVYLTPLLIVGLALSSYWVWVRSREPYTR